MQLKEIYTEFNDLYYRHLNSMIKKAIKSKDERLLSFFKECEAKKVDFTSVIYKKNIDDYEEVRVGQNEFILLPMGVRNDLIHYCFLPGHISKKPRITANSFRDVLLRTPKFIPYYYPNDSSIPKKDTLKKVCASYSNHYRESLQEGWSEEEFYKMLFELKYLSVKYAMDKDTKEIFAVGFFGFYVRNGAGGPYLTNGEIYVMPEFRHLGIAKSLIGLTFEQAKNDGIENFDSITYRVPNHDALAFWEQTGATESGLIHIEGNIPHILKKLSKENSKRTK